MPRFLLAALFALAACSSGGSDEKTALRFVHASPDADLLDVFVGSSAVFETVRFGNATGYDNTLDAGEQDVRIRSSANTRAPLRFIIDFIPDARQTLVAAGVATELRPIVLRDSVFAGQAQANVRLVHAAALSDSVTVFLFPEAGPPGAPLFENLAFRQNTGYLDLAPGTYRLQVTGGQGAGMLLDELVQLQGGTASLVVLADAAAVGGLMLVRVDG